jgi:hypothetical protein
MTPNKTKYDLPDITWTKRSRTDPCVLLKVIDETDNLRIECNSTVLAQLTEANVRFLIDSIISSIKESRDVSTSMERPRA